MVSTFPTTFNGVIGSHEVEVQSVYTLPSPGLILREYTEYVVVVP